MCRAATINETRALAIPYRARNHAPAAGAGNLTLIDARLSSRSSRYSHARLLVLKPHDWLLVFDWVWDNRKKNHDYRQWFHFAPDLTVTPSGRSLTVSGGDLDTDLKVLSLLPFSSVSSPVRGQEEPTLLGWWSEKGGQFEPVTSVNFHIEETSSAEFATLFAFSDQAVCSHADDQRVNASGRRARFRWSTGDRTHTLSFDRPAEGDVTVDYSTRSGTDSRAAQDSSCDS